MNALGQSSKPACCKAKAEACIAEVSTEARAEAINHLEAAVLADPEKAAALRGEQSRGTDADAALGPLLDELDESAVPCGLRQIAPAFRRYKQYQQAGGVRGGRAPPP